MRLFVRLLTERGNTAVELALVAPIVMSLISASIDLGAAYAQRHILGMAARAGAEAGVVVLASSDLSGDVPPWAAHYISEAAKRAARDLGTRVSVSVRWGGPVAETQRSAVPYRTVLRIPVVENTDQTVDTRHSHGYSWNYPQFADLTAWPTYQPGAWYADRMNSAQWSVFGLWSQHWYPDRSSRAYWEKPWGNMYDLTLIPPWAIGWVWWWAWDWFVSGFSRQDNRRPSDGRWVANGAWTAVEPWDTWRRTQTDVFGIADRYWRVSGTGSGAGTSSVDGNVFTFTYAVRQPDREVTVESLPAFQTVQQRPLVVEVTAPAEPVTFILSPILRGRTLRASYTATVTSVR